MTQAGTALTRLVIVAPTGRLDLALPEHLPVVGLLPAVLRHAGDDPALDGSRQGGWALRRGDGNVIDLTRSLAAQNVRDGEVLHLVPRRAEWPELSYDDLVDAIAAGARRRGVAWTPSATRLTGLIVATVVLLIGLVVVLQSGRPWWIGGSAALATAAVLLVTGITLSRAMANSVAGAVMGSAALPYAFAGGLLVLGGDDPLSRFGAPHVMLGSATMLLAGVLGYLGVADGGRVFVAAIVAGLYGCVGAALSLGWLHGVESAAVVVSAVTLLLPAMPLFAVRMGKIPLPTLPRTTDDLLRDEAQPRREAVYQATARADELLTGLIFGSVGVAVVGLYLLASAGTVASLLLTGIVAAALLLRTRLLVTVRHRVPLLVGGLAGVALLPLVAAAPGTASTAAVRIGVVLPVLLLVSAIVCAAGLTYSRRPPAPRLGRLGDILDVTLQLSVVPVACSVLGLYSFMRALNG